MTIHNDIKYFNKYLSDKLSPVSVFFGDPADYLANSKYVYVSWPNGDIDTSITYDSEAMACRIQGYTRENNINAHYDFGALIINSLKHKLALENGSVVEVRDIKPFYYDLKDFQSKPIRKVDITFNIRKFKENI